MEDSGIDFKQLPKTLQALKVPFDKAEANLFIRSKNLDKDNASRFLTWMITLNLINSDRLLWANAFQSMYEEYTKLVKRHLASNPSNPTSILDPNISFVIQADVERSLAWFNDLAISESLTKDEICHASDHALRIFTILTLASPNFNYAQGYDRYLLVSYLLSVIFASRVHLPTQFAEAMTYFLAGKLINLANISYFLEDAHRTEDYFSSLDAMIAENCRAVATVLTSSGHSSIHYALRWRILLFADEHSAKDLLFIWDQIIVNRSHLEDFAKGLCVSHVMQVPLSKDGESMVESLQNWRKWDAIKLTADAERLMPAPKKWLLSPKLIASLVSLALLFMIIQGFFAKN